MIEIPGTEEDPALPVAVGVDGMLAGAVSSVEWSLENKTATMQDVLLLSPARSFPSL